MSRTLTAALIGVWASLGVAPAFGQDPPLPKPSPTERQSQVNPAPRAHGDNQNRGRMNADYLWGVTNGNRTFDRVPYGRVPSETLDSPMFLDGWTFPFPRDGAGRRVGQNGNAAISDLLYPRITLSDEGATVLPPVLPGTLAPGGGVAIGGLWLPRTTPSTLFNGARYYRAAAVARPNGGPNDNPVSPAKFSWYPAVDGAVGSFQRYAIRVYIPLPAQGTAENRVSDARYVVYYQVPLGNGRFKSARKVCFVNQQSAGEKYLVGDDGQPAYFPFFSEATYASGGAYIDGTPYSSPAARARVDLDNSTENTGTALFVLADSIQLIQRPQTVKATPVVVPPHGGRKIDTAQTPTAADPYHQPATGPTYTDTDFVNNPKDPVYDANPLVIFDPSNVSTLFYGPISLRDPQASGNPVAPINATNHGPYVDGTGNLVPYFSHMQVLMARTSLLADPEVGVPDLEKDGTRTFEMGSVFALDWLTGTPLWRFPDRTYLPGGLRNPQIGTDPNGRAVYQVPGINSYDTNNDGVIDDDEVFVTGFGNNPSGGIGTALTVVPNLNVMGEVQVPVRDANGLITGVAPANRGRYYRLDASVPTGVSPIQMPLAFIASKNGILYAVDPYGNNDNRYTPNADTTILGTFTPGSTNLLWTFSPMSAPRSSGGATETLELYNRRLKTEVPVPGPYLGSAPVVAWAKTEGDTTLNRLTEEPRLFIGNQNGIVYALDPRAQAGINLVSNTVNPLPIRKGEQTYNAAHRPHTALLANDPYRLDLKWWFETLGSISASPAVSAYAFPRTAAAAPVTNSKGVYVTTGEGRVYCVDWDGPVSVLRHDSNQTWNGAPGDPLTAGAAPVLPPPVRSAAALNDNARFRNEVAALPGARPDLSEGTIRPRWAFPNRYRDISGSLTTRTLPIDRSLAYPGFALAEPFTNSGPIYSAPVLMDFAYLDPDAPATLSGIKRYVVVATNDYNSEAPDAPKQGRLFLLDQEGDRRDFLTNPMPSAATVKIVPPAAPVPRTNAVIYSQPIDQFVSKLGPFGTATPAWTYRMVYDTYTGAGSTPTITTRNAPTGATPERYPARRTVPTVFVGGAGRVYAIDLDEKSGLFQRWRRLLSEQETVLPAGVRIPGNLARGDWLNPGDPNNPSNPALNVGVKDTQGLATRPILARTVPFLIDSSSVDGDLIVTGGPVQNRNNAEAQTAGNLLTGKGAGQTTPPTVSLAGAPYAPSVPPIPTDDPPALRWAQIITATGAYAPFGYDLTPAVFSNIVFPIFDLTARYVNQDSDDPLSTTLGSYPQVGAVPVPFPDGPSGKNRAFQFPTLLVTTAGGFMHELSTNLEGEDPSLATTLPVAGEPTASLGWATTEDPQRYNDLHVYLVSRFGPGGAGAGLVAVTNAYFPGRDMDYARLKGSTPKSASDPSASFRFYPPNEPGVAGPGSPDFGDDPRPHLKPRSIFQGQAVPTTIAPDEHTGRTGLPLDLNGLFYDKAYATALGNTPNEAGTVRLPGYSGRGALTITGTAPFDPQRPEMDTERQLANDALPPGAMPAASANINPAGHNATWIFAAGEDGLLYAYTPVFARRLGGLSSGFEGGAIVRRRDTGEGEPKVDIFDQADLVFLRNRARASLPQRPGRDGTQPGLPSTNNTILSRAAKGQRNFFEWGESIPIVIWDITVRGPIDANTPPADIPPIPSSFSITLRITPRGGQTITRTVPLEIGNNGLVATYAYDRRFNTPPVDSPAGFLPARLGVAFYEFRVDAGSGLPVTPGVPIEVTVDAPQAITVVGSDPRNGPQLVAQVQGGSFDLQIMRREPAVFWSANPLAVQGYLLDTRTTAGTALPVSVPKAQVGDVPANGIGPFRHLGNTKLHVPRNGTNMRDPDRGDAEYSQALSNGNRVVRFDPDPYLTGAPLRRNPNFTLPLKDTNGVADDIYFFPVATSAGYVSHGKSGSTDIAANQRNLRIANRSLLPTLNRVRAEVLDDLIWRHWPGNIPNADAVTGNGRLTPNGMGFDGRINPLQWETPPTEAQPWKRRSGAGTIGTVLGNISPDYPDIPAASAALQSNQAISLVIGGGDAILGPVSLPSTNLTAIPEPPAIIDPLGDAGIYGAALTVRVPRFQPANLVAMHSLTSTYEAPSSLDGAQPLVGDGPLQLPRGILNRRLQSWNGSSFSGGRTITPYGYTARIRVYVDANGNGIWDSQNGEEPYRTVELWIGVPVDLGLRSVETPVDLGALPSGFGLQNGILGYGGTMLATEQAGLAPPPLRQPYAPFFRPFTIQNTGNVNLWNLRASQRVENPTTATPGSGNTFYLFGMRSETVDPRYGILAFGADPNASQLLPNVMPQVVTSLDRSYDAAWDTWYRSNPDPLFRAMMDYVTDNGQTNYQRYFRPTAGKHFLPKARAGSPTASVLGIPSLPAAQSLLPYGYVTPEPAKPMVAIAVPHGTPAGIYQSKNSQVAGAPPMLAVFEDHDTDPNNAYQPVPLMTGAGVIQPAGPRYNGFNGVELSGTVRYPGSGRPIFPAAAEGILRARAAIRDSSNTIARLEYQPHTNPAIDIKVTVSETPVTGESPDLPNLDAVFTGLLPLVDRFPLLDANLRPAAAVTPAAYRGANGRLNVYFSRNATVADVAQTGPGAQYQLFHTHMNWSSTLGVFVANDSGTPLANPSLNQGRWFTAPATVVPPVATDSHVAPFVLHTAPNADNALLLWTTTQVTPGGTPVDSLLFSRLDANGEPTGAQLWYLNPDPTVRRYGPRAVYVPNNSTTIAFFYGGVPGKWSLYYSPRAADGFGVPTDTAADGSARQSGEYPLTIPTALVSASEPTAFVRQLAVAGASPVIDVVYTGVLRAGQNPDLYLTRFRVVGSGKQARLVPLTLPIQNERLVQEGRELVWNARHVAWSRELTIGGAPNPFLPVITIQRADGSVTQTVQNRWQFDAAAQVLYQAIQSGGGVLYVYADTSSGVVRFRGPSAPTARDTVLAAYQPMTLRLTSDGAADMAPMMVFDTQTLAPGEGAHPGVIRRPSATPLTVGRQWILWQKGALTNRPAGLYFTARRVGVDLKSQLLPAVQRLQSGESILLNPPASPGAPQVPAVQSVTVAGVGAVPFEVDFVAGRIYVDPIYEGLNITVDYTAVRGNTTSTRQAVAPLDFIEELGATDASTIGLQVPMQRGVNEGQVYAFLDLYNPFTTVNRVNGPNPLADPTLVPGRLWMFWNSSRGRYGSVPQPDGSLQALPSGFDLLYQTLAPNFEVPTLSSTP